MIGVNQAALRNGRFAGLLRAACAVAALSAGCDAAQDAAPDPAQDPVPAAAPTGPDETETEASSGGDPAPAPAPRSAPPTFEVPLDEDGLPDPSFWMFDEGGHARDWLDKPAMDPADIRARLPAYEEVLADHGIFIDLEARELFVRGATIHDARSLAYPIEYLVVTELGRTYEALVIVRSQPSVLAACLEAMGVQPGGPTELILKDPLPPEAELEAGTASAWMVHPPHGPLMQLTMEWLDDGGKQHAPSLESLIIDARTAQPLEDVGWIFTGGTYGEYRQGREKRRRFKADVEGDVVAIYLAGLEVCVIERNSLDGLIDGYYFPHPDLMPAPGTPITLRFKLLGEDVPEREPFSAPTPLEIEAQYAAEVDAITADEAADPSDTDDGR